MEGKVIIVAVDASKEITDYALEWAVWNVIKAMDTLVLLAVLPGSRGRPPASRSQQAHQFLSGLLKKWGFLQNRAEPENPSSITRALEQEALQRINKVCEHMLLQQLRSAHNVKKVHTEVKVIGDAELGSVAAHAKELEATWVILDRRLKKEGDFCLKQLACNVVLIDHAIPRILRAVNPMTVKNLYASDEDESDPTVADMLGVSLPKNAATDNTSSSTLSSGSPNFFTDGSFSPKKSKNGSRGRLFLHTKSHQDHEADDQVTLSNSASHSKSQQLNIKASSFDVLELDSPGKFAANSLDRKIKSYSGPLKTKSEMTDFDSVKAMKAPPKAKYQARRSIDSRHLQRKPEALQKQSYDQLITRRSALESSPTSSIIDRTSSIRKAMSISIKHPPMPPPLCSICKHNAPIFGKAPRKFSYEEIARATGGFASENFLAEGGYGTIYRGVFPDGQVVAVKQHKMLSAQGASEFVSEVEVLSCAQHRNLVMLVGYCIETEWLLIYEFACNGSLDKHLYGGESDELMSWKNRMKVAKGAARGLIYLHEDCRVGCIVHRDFRPKNILLTHDFRPMVGDFGLARWQADGQLAEETRVIGAFGYLAPEYTQSGLITEKADVYAFGVVLLELLSGIKATDFSRNTGKQFAMDWGKPLLEKKMVSEIIDPRLDQSYVKKEVECMMYAASLCISLIPEQRPTMSKALKILEGDIAGDHMAYNLPGHYTPNYPKKYINDIYGKDTPICWTPSAKIPQNLQVQAKNKMNLSPSRLIMPLTASEELKVASDGRDLRESDLVFSEEYQEYLQGSLSKFIENLKDE